jgi:thiol-disulfide isomerase/thioredoxin
MANVLRRVFLVAAALTATLAATVAVLYAFNTAPAVPAASSDPDLPLVVKLHAQWCPYCLLQTNKWSRIERAYAGRVRFVVLDFTNERATERSRREAQRLNLGSFFDVYAGATGLIVVLDGRTREVLAEVGGNATLEEFRAAIETALQPRTSMLRQ